MPTRASSFVVLSIGYEHLMLPGSTNIDRLLKTLSPAIRVRHRFVGFRDDYEIDEVPEVKVEARIVPGVQIHWEDAPSTSTTHVPRTHTAALTLPKSRRLPA